MRAEKILLYIPLLKWYPSHGLKVKIRLKIAQRHTKLKGSSFYRKMIEDLMKHQKTTFTANEELVIESFRSPFFEKLIARLKSESTKGKSQLQGHTNATSAFTS